MRDLLTFSTQRRGHHIAALCQGQDRADNTVDFAIDASTLRRNSHLQDEWATRVEAAEHVYCGLVQQGMDEDAAWTLIEPLLPPSLVITTNWARSTWPAEVVADGDDELPEGGDDVFGQPFDR